MPRRVHDSRIAARLMGAPFVANFVEEGLWMLSHSCAAFEIDRF